MRKKQFSETQVIPYAMLKRERNEMKTFTAILERDRDTGHYVGYVPEMSGAHSQGETIEELRANLVEVLTMLLEDADLQK